MKEKPLVVVTEPVNEAAIVLLREVAEIRQLNKPAEEEMAEAVAGAVALFSKDAATRITQRVLEAGSKLRIVARHGAGYDNVDIAAATRLGIVVTSTPGVNADAVAEFALTMMLTLARNLVQANRSLLRGEWARRQFIGTGLQGKKLGLIGLGNIGTRVASMAQAFGMVVTYYDPFVSDQAASKIGAQRSASLDALLSQADVVSIHTALTGETRELINEQSLRLMKRTALLINNARGPIVNEEALYRALSEKRLAGAALDVFNEEPLAQDSPLRQLDNVILTPHLSSSTEETQRLTAITAAEEIRLVLSGKAPRYPLNPQVLERYR